MEKESISIGKGLIIGFFLAVVVLFGLLILGWRPVSVGIEAGPISIELAPPTSVVVQKPANENLEGTTLPVVTSVTERQGDVAVLYTPTAVSEWKGDIAVRKPTLNEIRGNMLSIWDANLLDVGDIPSPGTRWYKGTVNTQKEYLWPFRWCTLGKTLLEQNLEHLTVSFYVDDEPIPQEKIFYYHYNTSTGWNCAYWATVVGGWSPHTTIRLRLTYTINESIFDGKMHYSPGEYTHLFYVSVP